MLEIRPYEPGDLPALYDICLKTGFHGEDASGMVEPELYGHIYAAPYGVLEPGLCSVVTDGERAVGYILGTADSARFHAACEREWWPPLRQRYPLPGRDDDSISAGLIRTIHRGVPAEDIATDFPAHLHIDLLPVAQGQGFGARLIARFCDQLKSANVGGVHFGVSARNDRAIGFYEHLGFDLHTRSPYGLLFTRTL